MSGSASPLARPRVAAPLAARLRSVGQCWAAPHDITHLTREPAQSGGLSPRKDFDHRLRRLHPSLQPKQRLLQHGRRSLPQLLLAARWGLRVPRGQIPAVCLGAAQKKGSIGAPRTLVVTLRTSAAKSASVTSAACILSKTSVKVAP